MGIFDVPSEITRGRLVTNYFFPTFFAVCYRLAGIATVVVLKQMSNNERWILCGHALSRLNNVLQHTVYSPTAVSTEICTFE